MLLLIPLLLLTTHISGLTDKACEQRDKDRCSGEPEGKHLPNSLDCKGYYVCAVTGPESMKCSPGTFFDDVTRSCRRRNKVTCFTCDDEVPTMLVSVDNAVENETTTVPMLTTGLPRNLELCDEVKECSLLDSRLLLPDSTDCHYYYECLWTSTQQGFVRRFCQDGVIGVVDADTDLKFDYESKACITNANCFNCSTYVTTPPPKPRTTTYPLQTIRITPARFTPTTLAKLTTTRPTGTTRPVSTRPVSTIHIKPSATPKTISNTTSVSSVSNSVKNITEMNEMTSPRTETTADLLTVDLLTAGSNTNATVTEVTHTSTSISTDKKDDITTSDGTVSDIVTRVSDVFTRVSKVVTRVIDVETKATKIIPEFTETSPSTSAPEVMTTSAEIDATTFPSPTSAIHRDIVGTTGSDTTPSPSTLISSTESESTPSPSTPLSSTELDTTTNTPTSFATTTELDSTTLDSTLPTSVISTLEVETSTQVQKEEISTESLTDEATSTFNLVGGKDRTVSRIDDSITTPTSAVSEDDCKVCQHGATCKVNRNNEITCLCTDNYFGDICDKVRVRLSISTSPKNPVRGQYFNISCEVDISNLPNYKEYRLSLTYRNTTTFDLECSPCFKQYQMLERIAGEMPYIKISVEKSKGKPDPLFNTKYMEIIDNRFAGSFELEKINFTDIGALVNGTYKFSSPVPLTSEFQVKMLSREANNEVSSLVFTDIITIEKGTHVNGMFSSPIVDFITFIYCYELSKMDSQELSRAGDDVKAEVEVYKVFCSRQSETCVAFEFNHVARNVTYLTRLTGTRPENTWIFEREFCKNMDTTKPLIVEVSCTISDRDSVLATTSITLLYVDLWNTHESTTTEISTSTLITTQPVEHTTISAVIPGPAIVDRNILTFPGIEGSALYFITCEYIYNASIEHAPIIIWYKNGDMYNKSTITSEQTSSNTYISTLFITESLSFRHEGLYQCQNTEDVNDNEFNNTLAFELKIYSRPVVKISPDNPQYYYAENTHLVCMNEHEGQEISGINSSLHVDWTINDTTTSYYVEGGLDSKELKFKLTEKIEAKHTVAVECVLQDVLSTTIRRQFGSPARPEVVELNANHTIVVQFYPNPNVTMKTIQPRLEYKCSFHLAFEPINYYVAWYIDGIQTNSSTDLPYDWRKSFVSEFYYADENKPLTGTLRCALYNNVTRLSEIAEFIEEPTPPTIPSITTSVPHKDNETSATTGETTTSTSTVNTGSTISDITTTITTTITTDATNTTMTTDDINTTMTTDATNITMTTDSTNTTMTTYATNTTITTDTINTTMTTDTTNITMTTDATNTTMTTDATTATTTVATTTATSTATTISSSTEITTPKNKAINLVIGISVEGEYNTARCSVDTSPSAVNEYNFTWSLDGARIPMGERFSQADQSSTSAIIDILTIRDVKLSDQGKLSCTFEERGSNPIRKSYFLRVYPSPRVQIKPLTVMIPENVKKIITCIDVRENNLPNGLLIVVNKTFIWSNEKNETLQSNTYVTMRSSDEFIINGKYNYSYISCVVREVILYNEILIQKSSNREERKVIIFKKGVSKICTSEIADRIQWPTTPATFTVRKKCKFGKLGNASRKCDAAGVWLNVNLNGCFSKSLVVIDSQIDKMMDNMGSPAVISNELVQVTDNEKISVGDINKVVSLLGKFSTYLDSLDNKKTVPHKVTQDIANVIDNLLNDDNMNSWMSLKQDTSDEEVADRAAELMASAESVGKWFAMEVEVDHSESIVKDKIVIEVKSLNEVTQDLQFPLSDPKSDWIKSSDNIIIPKNTLSSIKQQGDTNMTIAVIATYFQNIGRILKTNESKWKVNSKVISLNIEHTSNQYASKLVLKEFKKPIHLSFENKFSNGTMDCSFWDFKLSKHGGGWSTKGCRVITTDANKTLCECDHMTNFAILMSPIATEENKILDIITIIGCSLSILGLVLTIVLFAITWKQVKSHHNVVLISICVSLIIANLIFLIGVSRTDNQTVCTYIAISLHYFYLVVFFSMLAEGIQLMLYIIFLFHVRRKKETAMLILGSWVVPAVIVGICVAAVGTDGYGDENNCWLDINSGLIYGFIGPVIVIILINFVILFIVMHRIANGNKSMDKKKHSSIRSTIWNLMVICPILGVSWIFGVFYVNQHLVVFQYIFVVANSLQGLMIFLVNAVCNRKIKDSLMDKLARSTTSYSLTELKELILDKLSFSNSNIYFIKKSENNSTNKKSTYASRSKSNSNSHSNSNANSQNTYSTSRGSSIPPSYLNSPTSDEQFKFPSIDDSSVYYKLSDDLKVAASFTTAIDEDQAPGVDYHSRNILETFEDPATNSLRRRAVTSKMAADTDTIANGVAAGTAEGETIANGGGGGYIANGTLREESECDTHTENLAPNSGDSLSVSISTTLF